MYWSREALVSSLAVVLVAHSACCAVQPSRVSGSQRTDVRYSVRASSSIRDLKDRLIDVPSDIVIGEVTRALETDPDFEDASLRSKGYQILVDRGGQMTPIGRRQLQHCLSEERYRGICAAALAEVPPEAQEEVIASLAQALEAPERAASPSSLVPILRALGRHGTAAKPVVGAVETVFQNRLLSPELRGAAARAMSRINGAAHALPILLGDSEAESNLWPLNALDTDPKEAYELDAPSRKMIQTFVLRIMRSSEKRIRQTAFESLFLTFEEDFVQGNATDGYFVNPELRRAIEEMAAQDPDDRLRERAQAVVDTLDQRLANAIRRRQNPEKYAPTKNAPSDEP